MVKKQHPQVVEKPQELILGTGSTLTIPYRQDTQKQTHPPIISTHTITGSTLPVLPLHSKHSSPKKKVNINNGNPTGVAKIPISNKTTTKTKTTPKKTTPQIHAIGGKQKNRMKYKKTQRHIKLRIDSKSEINHRLKSKLTVKNKLNKVNRKNMIEYLSSHGFVKKNTKAPLSLLQNIYLQAKLLGDIKVTKV